MTEPEKGVVISVRVRLTPREIETLPLLAEGLGNKQIARQLGISEHGAKRLVACIMLKLDSHSRTEAVVKAIRFGLIKLNEEEG